MAGSASAVRWTSPSRSTRPGPIGAVASRPPARRAAERRVDPLPGVVAAPGDRAGGRRQGVHQRVGRLPRRGHAATPSCSSSSSRSPGRPVRRCSSTRAERSAAYAVLEGGVVALPEQAPRRLGPAERVHVAEPAAALLEVGLEQERHLAGRLRGARALVVTAPRATAWPASATARASAGRRSSVRSSSPATCRTWRNDVAVSRSSAARVSASLVRAHGVAELHPLVPDRVPDPIGQACRCRSDRCAGARRRCRTAGSARPGRSPRPRPARRHRRRTRPRRRRGARRASRRRGRCRPGRAPARRARGRPRGPPVPVARDMPKSGR